MRVLHEVAWIPLTLVGHDFGIGVISSNLPRLQKLFANFSLPSDNTEASIAIPPRLAEGITKTRHRETVSFSIFRYCV